MSKRQHNGPPVDGGYFKVWRSMLEHGKLGLKRPFSNFEATIFLLAKANYKDGSVFNAGRKMELKRGSLLGATSWLAHEFGWSPKKVRIFLDHLENSGTIIRQVEGSKPGKKKGRFPTRITFCNYDLYQGEGPDEGQVIGLDEGQVKGSEKGETKDERKKINKQNTHTESRAMPPHMNGVGFVVDAVWDISIPHDVVDRWRSKYPNIPDLDVELEGLAVSFMGNSTACQRYREFPEKWFERILAKENKKLEGKTGEEKESKTERYARILDKIAEEEASK